MVHEHQKAVETPHVPEQNELGYVAVTADLGAFFLAIHILPTSVQQNRANGPKHPITDRPQAGSVLLESRREPVAFVHRSHSSVVFRHYSDEHHTVDVTELGSGGRYNGRDRNGHLSSDRSLCGLLLPPRTTIGQHNATYRQSWSGFLAADDGFRSQASAV